MKCHEQILTTQQQDCYGIPPATQRAWSDPFNNNNH